MKSWQRITRSNFIIKLKSWEYWPFGIVQFPAMLYWLWLSLRARSLVFFSASNPGIPMGGLLGESKFEILQKIPARYIPRTLLISVPVSAAEVMNRIKQAGMALPVIFKPDIGERGFMVRKISSIGEIESYLKQVTTPFLAQQLLTQALEFGVFYAKFPGDEMGKVISVVAKEMLSVIGDGKSTLRDLIFANDRAKLQWRKLKSDFRDLLDVTVEKGKRIELVSIGNHALGTRFINANYLIDQRLSKSFDEISRDIKGFYFGRFDLRCNTVEDLYRGEVQIMELNGCGAEPAHIYDTEFSLWQGVCELVRHWNFIFRIARANRRRGVKYISHREAFAFYRKFKSVVK